MDFYLELYLCGFEVSPIDWSACSKWKIYFSQIKNIYSLKLQNVFVANCTHEDLCGLEVSPIDWSPGSGALAVGALLPIPSSPGLDYQETEPPSSCSTGAPPNCRQTLDVFVLVWIYILSTFQTVFV